MASSCVIRAFVVALLGLALVGCSGPDARVYTARKYEAAEACIEGSVPIGVVHVDSLPSTCDPVCLLLDDALYVSTVCAPYPTRATLVSPEETPECGLAIALLEAEAICGDDVVEPTDAGSTDAGSSDAGSSDAASSDAEASAVADAAPSDGGGAVFDEAGSDASPPSQ